MTEAQLQSAVIECARLLGWRVAHFRAARTAHGWRTPVGGDGAGFPDLVLLRPPRLLFVELKSDVGRLGEAQREWIMRLKRLSHCETFVWAPEDWQSGTVEAVLRRDAEEYAARPGIVVRFELGRSPRVIVDASDAEAAELSEWLDARPAWSGLLAAAVELAEEAA